MARKKSTAQAHQKADEPQWGGFINVNLNEAEKEQFFVWRDSIMPELWLEFTEVVSRGFKFGLSYEPDGDFWLATLTGHGVDLVGMHDRYCLTARAPEWETAIALLLFKHVVLAKGTWAAYRPRDMRFDNFG